MTRFTALGLDRLTTPMATPTRSRTTITFWLSLSLAFSVLYSSLALHQAFKGDYVVQDDVRQHVFWMWRFVDPDLLPNDLIADYFQSVAPTGYTVVYKLAATVGIHPLVFSKILPMGLGIIGTFYCFYLFLQVLPVPMAAFFSTVLLNQSLWMGVDLGSGTPRAFIYPLLLAFLYYLTRRSIPWCPILIVLQSLFYPPLVLLSAGFLVVRLVQWNSGTVRFTTIKEDYRLGAIGVSTGVIVLLPYLLFPSAYGPTITATVAKTMPEFLPGGRSVFFDDNLWFYWLGGDSGLLHRGLTEPLTLVVSLFLPLMFLRPRWFPLLQHTTDHLKLLSQILVSSIGLFFAAHILLFKLYAPNRYTQHTFRVVMAVAAAIVFVTGLDLIARWISRGEQYRWLRFTVGGLGLIMIGGSVVLYPCFMESFLEVEYVSSDRAELYQFLQQQPRDSLIASLTWEADNISTFAARSVLVSREHSRPYDVAFYREFRQRVSDLIRAQYSFELTTVQNVIRHYNINFWLLDSNSFSLDFIQHDKWLQQFQPEIGIAIDNLRQNTSPALREVQNRCLALETQDHILLQADCMLEINP